MSTTSLLAVSEALLEYVNFESRLDPKFWPAWGEEQRGRDEGRGAAARRGWFELCKGENKALCGGVLLALEGRRYRLR